MAVPLYVPLDIRRRHIRRRTTLEQLSESEIRKHCGLPSYCVRDLIDLYEPIDGTISTKIPLDTKLIVFFSQLRSGSFQWVVGSNCGLTQSCASKIISSCCDQTLTFARDLVKIPTSLEDRIKIKQDFYNIGRIPNILGVIDGTHVPIIAPHLNEPAYVNRKQFHSINCQVVAGTDYQLFDIVATIATPKDVITSDQSLAVYRGPSQTTSSSLDKDEGVSTGSEIPLMTPPSLPFKRRHRSLPSVPPTENLLRQQVDLFGQQLDVMKNIRDLMEERNKIEKEKLELKKKKYDSM